MTRTAGELIVRVLGPCLVTSVATSLANDTPATEKPVELSAAQGRILARLALSKPDYVGVDELADAIWGDEQPATALTSIYNQISRIRGRLGPDVIATSSDGRYVLAVPTDVEVAVELLTACEAAIADQRFGESVTVAERALLYWRGVPYADLEEYFEVVAERRRLVELRRSLETLRLEASIGSGALAWSVVEAERLVALTPEDEHRWVLLMQALAAGGRRGDALGAYERARRALAERLGLEPSAALRAAESAVLDSGETRREALSSTLFGRAEVIKTVLSAVEASDVLLLAGEHGIGKSRILSEIQRKLRHRRVTVARSDAPLHAYAAVAVLKELADGLGESLDILQSPVDAFRRAVQRAVRSSGDVVLLVDDIDRVGPTTMEAIRFASGMDGVALIATAVDGEVFGGDSWLTVLPLQPLDSGELAEFAEGSLGDGGDVAPDRLQWLVEMSGGNPAFLEHLLADPVWLAVRDEPAHAGESVEPRFGQPEVGHLDDVVRLRLDRLGYNTRMALEVAAVCGQSCPEKVLVELVGEDGLAGGIAASLLSSIGTEDDRSIGFRHGAVQQVLYNDLTPGRRMEIHYHAARVFRAHGAPIPIVAWHSSAAAEVDPVSAARDATRAAEAASEQGAHAEAALWYDRAVKAADRLEDNESTRVAAMIGYGDSLRRAGSPDQEAALFAAADAAFVIGSQTLIAEAVFAVLQLGVTTDSGTLHARAVKLAEQALAIVDQPDSRALIAGGVSLAHSMSADSRLCRELFLESVRLATSPATRCQILPFAYLGLGHPSDLGLREQLTGELLRLSREAVDPIAEFEALQLAYSVALQRCDGDGARQAVLESAKLIEKVGDVGRRWSLAYQQAAISFLDGDLDSAEAMAEEGMAIFGSTSPSRAFAAYGAQILAIRMVQGRVDELAPILEGLVADQPGVPAWNSALALAIGIDDPPRALRLATAALDEVVDDFTWLAAHVVGGRAAALVGDRDLCSRYVERLLPYSGHGCWQGTCSYGPVDTVLWRLFDALGDSDAASTHGDRALDRARTLQAPPFLAELDC